MAGYVPTLHFLVVLNVSPLYLTAALSLIGAGCHQYQNTISFACCGLGHDLDICRQDATFRSGAGDRDLDVCFLHFHDASTRPARG
jgi:hypothetical protein